MYEDKAWGYVLHFYNIECGGYVIYVQAFKRLPHVIEVDARGVTDSFWIICSQVIYPIVGSITVLLFMAWMLFLERFYKEKSDISI